MTVAEMLSRIDSYELTEWEAFERANGPLGTSYSDDMLASIHEMMQYLLKVYGQVNYGEDNPYDSLPQPVHRPDAVFRNSDGAAESAAMSPEEFDREFDN